LRRKKRLDKKLRDLDKKKRKERDKNKKE